jgi:succinate-semialdehyde dehydrogenase / glutarate-semialdehyde dehydrogenase
MTIAKLTDVTLLRSHCYLDGAWVSAESGETITITNPATGETVGSVPNMGVVETRRAIKGASEAFPGLAGEDRKGTLNDLTRLV